jgi:hypothetical protein
MGKILLAGVLLLAVLAGYARIAYPGLFRGSVNQILHSTAHENRNLWFCLGYWMEFIQKVRLDPNTGNYNFNTTPLDGLSDYERARIEFHRGEFAKAITLIQSDIRRSGESEDKLFWLGLSHMRQAENENCLPMLRGSESAASATSEHDHTGTAMRMCSLPLVSFHQKAQFAQASAEAFHTLLDRYDSENRLYRWLLNFNYMTMGRFPDGVPPRYRIQTKFIDTFYGKGKERTRAEFPYLSFADESKELGVNTFHPGRGVAVEDFDGDGYLDIVTGGSYGPVRYYKNDHGRGFIDRTIESGLNKVSQVFAIVAADYDNDGLPDLFICRPFDHYVLYRNVGGGTFVDVTKESGLLDAWSPEQLAVTWIPSFADVNNDGRLDLFLAQWAFKMPFTRGVLGKPRMDSTLFIQENGRFVDRTREYGLKPVVRDYYYIGSAFGDYDNDGFPDLFLSSPLRNSSILLHNVGGRRFEESGLIKREASGFAASFLDINHDGRLDIFQAGFGDAKSAVEQVVFGEHTNDYHSGHSAIYLQTPDGKFEAHEELFDMPMSTMGSSFGDINNDGCYDFYLGKGTPEPWFILPNLMYLGRTRGTQCILETANISMLEGFGNIQKGHGIVFFDFNNDGRQDIYSALGGMWPGDRWTSQLFVNRSETQNTWTKIRLRGRKTNYFGVGATIRVRAVNAQQQSIVRYYHMDQKTGFGGAPFLAHVGLMNATRIEGVDVFWPASGCRVTYPAALERLNILDENACGAGS